MAMRRMFSKEVIDTDAFSLLSLGARGLYLHLNLAADDDGFISSTIRTVRGVGASEAELTELLEAGFLIRFDSGIYLIRHWHLHNKLQKDRYKPTIHLTEKSMVTLEGGIYRPVSDPNWIQNVSRMDTQESTGENKSGQLRQGEGKTPPPTSDELSEYAKQIGYEAINAEKFLAYYDANGWRNARGEPVTDWQKLVDLWKAREKDFPHGIAKKAAGCPGSQRDYDFEELERHLIAN